MLLASAYKTDHFSGNTDAKMALLVYEDYECEYCSRAFKELKTLCECYKDEICIVYKNFPFIRMHPHALLAARVVEACSLQNKFIQAHDLIFECQEYLEYGLGGILRILEKNLSISIGQLNKDMQKEDLKRKVNDDIESSIRRGIKNTPAIFINDCMYTGEVKFEQMAKAVEEIHSKRLSK
ncbi:MAG: DsbA family protein [Segetibacter sp.]